MTGPLTKLSLAAMVLSIVPLCNAYSDTVTYEWAKGFGSVSEERGEDLILDNDRNVYVTGYFQHTVDFDPGAGMHELTSDGTADVFILKLDSDGNFVWVKQIGGTGIEVPFTIKMDADGNLYVLGTFWDTTDFDPGPATANLTAKGQPDTYILKLDKNGNFVWVKQLRGKNSSATVYSPSLALDSNGNLYLSGHFTNTADFDPGTNKANLDSVGFLDVFILKLHSDGSFVWVKQLGGSSSENTADIVVDLDGYIYICGSFNSTLDLDPGPDIDIATSAGQGDIYLIKLGLDGNHIWSHTYGAEGEDEAVHMALDNNGDVILGGVFSNTVQFAATYTLTSQGLFDVFVAKVSQQEGTGLLWATPIGGTESDFVGDFCTDDDGNIYVGGLFHNTANFGVGIGQIQYSSRGSADIFQAKYAFNGSLTWAVAIGDDGNDGCNALAIDSIGNTYSTGFFGNAVIFDPNPSFIPPLTSIGETDIFACKLNYIPNGSVKVKLKPKSARQAGAAWRIDNAPPWRKHNELLNDVSIGQHTIQFKAVPGRIVPSSKAITIDANEIEALSGKYKPEK